MFRDLAHILMGGSARRCTRRVTLWALNFAGEGTR